MPPLPERQLHRLTHWPYRSWCKACVVGGGREEVHTRTDQERDTPQVWIDYSFPGMKGTDDVMTLLVCLDFESTAIESANVLEKGTVEYGIKVLVQALQYWGRKRVVMSSDQENAITALARAAAAEREDETVIQVGPRRDSKSKGPIEAAGGRVQQLIRTLVYTVNAHYKVELKPSDPISSWLARHSGWILTRFTVREDGLTPYRRLKGRDYHGQIAEFAETVMYKLAPGAAGKMEARWEKGIWLGKANVSDEHLIGTPRGRFSRDRLPGGPMRRGGTRTCSPRSSARPSTRRRRSWRRRP